MSKKSLFSSSSTMDLSQGNIFSRLMVFALPLLAGQFLQTLYNSVDSIVIGNFETANALAAVSASSTVAMILSGFFTGLSAGASAILARFFGAKDYKNLHDAIHTTVFFSILLGIVLSGLGIIFTPQLLMMSACPDEVFSHAVVYLRIYLIGVLFTSVYNIGASVLRAIGNSLSPFIYLVIASAVNVVLDVVFVAIFDMGVAGVATATVIAQFISMVLVFIKMGQMDDVYRFRFSHTMIDWRLLGQVVKLGIPAGLQTSIIAISNIFIQRYINSFSSVAIAGIGTGMRIDQFVGMFCITLGLAMTTFIGQNIGAGKISRTHKSTGIALVTMAVFVLVVGTPVYIFASKLVGIFSPDPKVIAYGTGMLQTIMPFYIFMGLNGVMSGVLRGYGYSLTAMICSTVGMVVCRQIWLALSFSFIGHDIQLIYYCYPVGWFLCSVPMVLIYIIRIRKKFPKESGELE